MVTTADTLLGFKKINFSDSSTPCAVDYGRYSQTTSVSAPVKKPRSRKKILRYILAFLVIAFIAIIANSQLRVRGIIPSSRQNQQVEGVESQVMSIGRDFTFDGLDQNGKPRGKINLKIDTAEKTDQVIVQEKNYTAKNGKTFLIVNLALTNSTTERLNIFTGDLIRLVINDNQETKFAPDLHNNYVLVAPISTKIDRIGFVIDKSDQKLSLQVGELDKDKETLELKF